MTSRTTALLLISQLGLNSLTFPWFLSCLLMFIFPSIVTLITDGVSVIIQPISAPPWKQLCLHLLLHSVHISGLILLTFFSLPSLPILQSTCLLGSISVAPAILHLLKFNIKGISMKVKFVDFLCFLIQFSGLISWPLVLHTNHTWSLPIGLFLTSLGFCLQPLAALGHDHLDLMNQQSTWTGHQRQLFSALTALTTFCLSSIALLSPYAHLDSIQMDHIGLPFLLLGLQLASSFLIQLVGFFSCRTRLYKIGFAAPLTIAPVLSLLPICLLIHFCPDMTSFHGLQLSCSPSPSTLEFVVLPIVFILTYASQCWILRRTSSAMNCLPALSTTFLADSILLSNVQPKAQKIKPSGRPTILACATMWHETAEEMRALLVSVFEVDRDQAVPQNIQNFKWEVHVLFDDAINCNHCTGEIVPNEFLRLFCQEMKSLMTSYSRADLPDVENVTITKMPYGGLLIWTLPGGSMLFCHMKEKVVIRNKKRWSQCMYFLYFLGHPLLPTSPFDSDQPLDNTFILALDGDVEFSYSGVKRLMEVMQEHPKTGGVCAQMQPKRSKRSLQIFLQIFEYLTGHMMFKATEHVIGNVRCAPGCFSLFRASAMKENRSTKEDLPSVIDMYSSVTKRGHECLVYDLGEDLWLCMMIIQRGWRVRYCALSDVFTQCPEELSEFLKQRRRWTVSGTVNILRVLFYWHSYVRHGGFNLIHILYQSSVAFFGILVGPAVMYTMLVFGLSSFTGLESYISAIIVSVPIIALVISTCFTGQKMQTRVVLVSSGLYGLLFITTFLYELITGIASNCYTSPIVITYAFVFGSYIAMTILHPRQIPDFFYGLSYPITLPFMFMILPLYCLLNMDDVSWGTREVKNTAEADENTEKIDNEKTNDFQQITEWTFDIYKKNVQMASNEIENFWNKTIETFLKPSKLKEEQEKVIKKDLRIMKIVSVLVLFSTNVGYSLLMILKMSFPLPSKWAIGITFCTTSENVDFIDVSLFVFVTVITLFLLLGTFLHRMETLSHIVRTTTVIKKKTAHEAEVGTEVNSENEISYL